MNPTRNDTVFQQLREQYPGTRNWAYMDVAARGLLSRGVRQALDEYLDHRMEQGGDKEWMFSMTELARERFAALIGAQPDEISLTKNVTEGINAFAFALPWEPGDNVVICSELEHPANIYPWYSLARQRGVVIKTVPAENGRIPLDRIAEAIDGRTRVVTAAMVSFAPGFRAPIREISELCRRTGALLLVDAAQTVGILHTDVRALGIDGLSVATQKGLLGLYGMGFLYVRQAVAEQMHPAYLSRMGIHMDETHEAATGNPSDYLLARGARRFDLGNFNFIGAIAAAQSIAELAAVGSQAIEAHVCGLAQELAMGLIEAGLPVFGGASCPDRAHIVAIGSGLSDEHDSTDDAMLKRLHDALMRSRVRHTIRRGVVRLSLHAYNNEDDVRRVVSAAREFMEQERASRTV